MISAQIIADSKNEFGNRLTTFVLIFPRWILAELNTHRMLSKNSASSRAIPYKKMLEKVETNPVVPIKWMKDHSGMQGNEYFTEQEAKDLALYETWIQARNAAVKTSKELSELGLSKQFCNRILEPFLWHKVIITGTEWENFFALRAHPAAEIHIEDLAQKMLLEYNKSQPVTLKPGQWHIPFGDKMDPTRLNKIIGNKIVSRDNLQQQYDDELQELKVKIATARCARVSYDNFDGTDDYLKDLELFERLKTMGHMSPFEHCAKTMNAYEFQHNNCELDTSLKSVWMPGMCGNFRGFIQLRKTFQGENKSDSRVNQV